MNKVKQYWKEILIVLLVLFGMNKCATSCNRGNKLDRANADIAHKDSVIEKLRSDSTIISTRFTDAQGSIDAYRGIATNNQQELINKVSALTNENDKLKKEVSSLKAKLRNKK